MKRNYLLLFAAALTLSGCSGDSAGFLPGNLGREVTEITGEEPSAGAAYGETDVPVSEAEAQTDFSAKAIAKAFYDNYIDVSNLPMLDLAVEWESVFDDRLFRLEDSIDNEAELLVYYEYYYKCAADFEGLKDLAGENEVVRISAENEEARFREGVYMSAYTVHGLDTFAREDLDRITEQARQDISDKIEKFGLTGYVIVHADVSWKHNEASLAGNPQLDDGRYDRYYLLAETEKLPEFKLYEVYWEDFLVEPRQ